MMTAMKPGWLVKDIWSCLKSKQMVLAALNEKATQAELLVHMALHLERTRIVSQS